MSFSSLKKIGKYDVEKVIGRGGMGIVFKGTDPALGRPVAIKMMTASYAEDPDLLKRFFREAQFTGNLHHPNIVTVYDLGDLDGNPYLVMEFLEGESLDAIINSGRDVSVLNKITYLTHVCAGLEYAHQQRIIHRDIKPGNVMVLNDGSVKIVDFGIARLGNDRLTRPRQVMGSYHYMAPEQINDKEVDARTDIFATGVVLYQLLTYKLPFDAEDIVSTLLKIMNDPAPSLSESLSSFPPELDDIVGRALQKKKEDRYQSAEEFSIDLMQVAEKLKQEAIGSILHNAEKLITGGELTQARQEVFQALKIDRQNIQAGEMMRRIQQLVQKRQRAEQARVFLVKAEDALANRDFDQAISSLDQAQVLDPSDPDISKLTDVVRELKARTDAFRDAMREAASAQAAGDLNKAQNSVEAALAIESEHPQALALQESILHDLEEQARRKKLEQLLEDARVQISAGTFTRALEILEEARTVQAESPAIDELVGRANAGIEQERRRQELESITAHIRDALAREDFAAASSASEEALRRFPSDQNILKLKSFADKERAALDRRHWIQGQIVAAQTLTGDGKSADAVQLLRAAAAKYPGEPSLQSAIVVAEQMLARENAERRKAEFSRNARDCIRREAYDDAIRILERANSEYPDTEFDDLLHFAREERASQLRERHIEKVTAECRRLMQAEKYQDAIHVVEAGMREYTDQRLTAMASEAQRRLAEFERGVQEAISASQRLVAERRTDDALSMLNAQPPSYKTVPDFRSAVDTAKKAQARLRAIGAAKQPVATALAKHDLERASALLEKCRREFGAQPDFDEIQAEIDRERRLLREQAVEREISEVEMLARVGSYAAALQKLDEIGEADAIISDPIRQRYDSVKEISQRGVERLKREAEERERERVEAERLERERQQRSHQLAEERAKEELARKAAEERERQLQQAREAARQAERARSEVQPPPDSASVSPGSEPTIDITRERIRNWPTPPSPGSGEPKRPTPVPRHRTHEHTVAELTPPEGVRMPGPTATWPAGVPGLSKSSPTGSIEAPPPAETAPPATTVPQSTPSDIPERQSAELPQVSAIGRFVKPLGIAAALLVALAAVLVWVWSHRAPATVQVEFSTVPAGVTLRVKDQSCTSPCRMSLEKGDHVVDAQLKGYAAIQKSFSTTDRGSPQAVALNMKPLPATAPSLPPPPVSPTASAGTLVVRANVENATIVVDDKRYDTTTGNVARIPLEPKQYKVHAEKDGYTASRARRITIQKDADAEIAFNLTPVANSAPVAQPTTTAPQQQSQTDSTKPPTAPEPPPQTPVQETASQPTPTPVPPPPPAKPVDDGESLWASIGNGKARDEFEKFRSRYPSSPHAEQAAKKIEQIDWETARDKHDVNAIQAFLSRYPNSGYTGPARNELEKLSAESQRGTDRQAIVSVLKRFEASYNNRDASQLAQVWPSLPSQELKKIRESFKQANAVHMRLEYSDPAISGDHATVSCRRTVQFEFKEGAQPERTDQVNIQLRKSSGGLWHMESVQ